MITRQKIAGVFNDLGWYAFGWSIAAASFSGNWWWALVAIAFPVFMLISWVVEFKK